MSNVSQIDPSFPIMCMICNETVKGDVAYMNHMQTVHSARNESIKQNIPPDMSQAQVPVVPLSKDAPPSAEFMEIVKMMDSQPQQTPQPVKPQTVTTQPVAQKPKEIKPLELKYKYEGGHSCGNAVQTIMIKAAGELWANAFCMACGDTVMQVKVHPIYMTNKEIVTETTIKLKDMLEKPKKKGGGKNVKRTNALIRNNTTIQQPMPVTRLPQDNEASTAS